ncbi:unnamed protein product, partial [Arctogadus glacialis]
PLPLPCGPTASTPPLLANPLHLCTPCGLNDGHLPLRLPCDQPHLPIRLSLLRLQRRISVPSTPPLLPQYNACRTLPQHQTAATAHPRL